MAARLVAVLFLVCLPAPACLGQEEVVLNKKRSEWLAILKDHKETKFRRVAVVALTVIGPRAKGVLEGLFEALEKDGDPEVRREIALTLGSMGADAKGAVDVLGDVLKRDKADAVREAAATVLAGKLNDQAFTQVRTLARTLKDPHAGTRAAAAEALKNLGDKARLALPELTELAKDPKADRFPRLYALQVISKLGDDGALKVLIGVFEDRDAPPAVRQGALEGIGQLGDKGGPAVSVLARGLTDNDVELRRAAGSALGKVGAKVKEVWPAIKDAYLDADIAVRYQVIRLAGGLGKEQKEAILLLADAAQKDVNLQNRLAALQELGQLESAAAQALPVLTRLAADDVLGSIRKEAQEAVKRIKGTP